MRVLVACELSGVVREAFRARGHDAWSCDLQPAEDQSPFHWRGDVLELLEDTRSDPEFWPPFDLMIAHPPCQYLSSSGLHWNRRRPSRILKTEAAIAFAVALWNAPIQKVALENPIGCLSKAIRKPDQIIQPYDFGEDASKATCLWLRGVPLLKPTHRIDGRMAANGKERWANQTDSGQNRLGPSPTRAADRARTYHGVASAIAEQWGG